MPNTLRQNLNNWEKLDCPPLIIDWISNGVQFPLTVPVENISFLCNNRKFSLSETKFIDSEIADLLKRGAIEKCADAPQCVSPINCVPKKSGKYRLVIDLRCLNNFCAPPSCKYEDIGTVIQVVKPKDHIVTLDLKNGFHHVPIHAHHKRLLGFRWKGKFYIWNVLPFGHNCSSYIFTKTLRPIIAHLRSKNIRVVLYVDDFALFADSTLIHEHRDYLVELLSKLGWTINFEKSHLEPSVIQEYIGYTIDNSAEHTVIKIPRERIYKLRKDIHRVLIQGYCSARVLARIAGKCVAMTKVIIPSKLMLRNIYRLLATRQHWQQILHLDPSSVSDLEWWYTSIQRWNGLVVSQQTIDCQIMTDASASGWGAALANHFAQGHWTPDVSHRSSNFRELLTVLLALQSFKHMIRGKVVQILSDNVTTVAFINHMGGSVKELDTVMRNIYYLACHLNVTLKATHLAGKLNVQADFLSRIQSAYELRLHPRLFRMLDETWGPHDIDRFASMTTTQLPAYNSYHWDPFTSGMDAIAQTDWAHKNNYVNAPFFMIPRILELIVSYKADATIIAPHWPAQHWMQTLKNLATEPPIRLPLSRRTVWAVGPKVEPLKNPKWTLYAWRISGRNA